MVPALNRRELIVNAASGVAFVAVALAFWIASGAPAPGLQGLALLLLCALLSHISFTVGTGSATSVMLAVIPMLMLLPPGVVPLLVGGAQLAGMVPRVLSHRRYTRLVLPLAQSWYPLAPALLVLLVGVPSSLGAEALLVTAAFIVLVANDLLAWPLLLWLSTGESAWEEVRLSFWVYRLDALLVPIGFAAALATRQVPAAPAAILPLAALLAFLARERRGREEQASALEKILEHASDLILIVHRDGRMQRVMGSAVALLGEATVHGTLLDRVHPEDVDSVRRFLARAPGEAEWRLRHSDGSYRHVSGVAADLTGDPHVRGLVLTVRDDEVRQALRHRALHDPLTGLANRTLFHERVGAALADGEASVLYLDLNGFKPVNDRLGHAAGDEVLRIVARRLERCVRAGDTVARLGGDEFGLVITAPGPVTERIRAAFDDPIIVAGEALAIGAAIGLATGHDAESLLAAADRAMYADKFS